MSFQMMAWAAEQQTGSGTRKAVLIALANRANHDTGACHPSVEAISAETEFSATTVKQALKDLVDAGMITRTRRRRRDGSLGTYEYGFPRIGQPTDQGREPTVDLEPGADSQNQEEPLNQEDTTTDVVVSRAPSYDPVRGRRVDGQDLPWNALMDATSAYGAANGARMTRALKSIRQEIWDAFRVATPRTVTGYQDEDEASLRRLVEARWQEYERRVADLIKTRAIALIESNPTLTYGPEGIARNWTRAASLGITDVASNVDQAVEMARLGDS